MKKYIATLCIIIVISMCISIVAFGDDDYELPKIPLTGDTTTHVHSWTDWTIMDPEVPATCTTNGTTAVEIRVCTIDISHTETRGGDVIPATGHNLIPHEKVPATDTQPGTEAYWECETCHALFSDSEGENSISQPIEIPVLGYGFTITGIVKVATEETGTEYAEDSAVANATVNALDSNGNVLETETTDSFGKFSIDVPSGAVSLTISKYCVPTRTITLSGDSVEDYPIIPVIAIDYDESSSFGAGDKNLFTEDNPDADLDGSSAFGAGDGNIFDYFMAPGISTSYAEITL